MESVNKLDVVYYSILERLSSLQSTIGGLQDLATQTKDLRETFDDDAKAIKKDIGKQVVAFGSFSKQKAKIEKLELRIRDGRTRTERLTERLEVARDRVQLLETQEAEVQASISCRCKGLTISWHLLIVLQFNSAYFGLFLEV
jgi:chromosome segregation ATPase